MECNKEMVLGSGLSCIFIFIFKMTDVDQWIEQLRNGEILKETEVKILCNKAKDILNNEDNVIRVEAPVTVFIVFIIDMRRHPWPILRPHGTL